MALGALAAHKMRSALTLLGVVVGVFSIIVVMTAMRVMQSNIEKELGQLGAQTFSVQKHPAIFINGHEGWEKIMRRKNITWQQVQALKEKATLAQNVAVEAGLARDSMSSRYAQFEADVAMSGVTPEIFAARNWVVEQGRAILSSDVDSARTVCVLGSTVARQLFPHSSAVGEKIKFRGIQYLVVGVLESRGRTWGDDQDSFLVIPLTTGFNRFGVQWRSLTILIQASAAEFLEDTMEQVRGVLRTIRKVPPQDPDDFELFTNDTLIAQFRTITFATGLGPWSLAPSPCSPQELE